MHVNLWTFLTAAVIFGSLFLMVLVFVTHRKTMKELDIEALKIKSARLQAGIDEPVYSRSNAAPHG